MAVMPTKPRFVRTIALVATAPVLALGMLGCGGDDGTDDGEGTPTVAEGEIVDAKELRACLTKANIGTADAAPDAVVAAYAGEATEAGGDSFVIQNPIAQLIVFPDRVDLAEAEEELTQAAARQGLRAKDMQADAYGNVVVVYFVAGGADKTAVTGCLGADAPAVPGFEIPLRPIDLAPGATPVQ